MNEKEKIKNFTYDERTQKLESRIVAQAIEATNALGKKEPYPNSLAIRLTLLKIIFELFEKEPETKNWPFNFKMALAMESFAIIFYGANKTFEEKILQFKKEEKAPSEFVQ